MRFSRSARLGALATVAALASLGLAGCFGGGAAPQCSTEIIESFEESGSGATVVAEFPAPELLVGGGIYCWIAFEGGDEVGGIAFFEGENGDEVAIERLTATGFTESELLPGFYEKGDLIASVGPSEGVIEEGQGAPDELVGKELALLFIGSTP